MKIWLSNKLKQEREVEIEYFVKVFKYQNLWDGQEPFEKAFLRFMMNHQIEGESFSFGKLDWDAIWKAYKALD